MNKKDWFEDWFNTHYYHLLYNHRNESEAKFFMNNLLDFIHLKKMGKILDAACGKGRHSIYLNSQGYNVTGIDLSAKSINEASKFENDSLSFFEHDIRLPFRINYFDSVFNLFTSFGYFQKQLDNMACLSNFFNALKPGGYFLFDFLNSNCVVANYKENTTPEVIKKENVEFAIQKKIENNFIIKEIKINDNGKVLNFLEKVQLIKKDEIIDWLQNVGFEINAIKGDYELSDYTNNSERLIVIAQKPASKS
jgi:SAM-dependent methyltransferase